LSWVYFKRFTEIATLLVIIVGLYFAWDQAGKLNESLVVNNRSMAGSTWSNIATLTMETDKAFVENPKFLKYFYEGVEVAKGDEDYYKALSLTMMMLDYADSVMAFAAFLSPRIPASESLIELQPWKTYFTSLFRTSPLMCKTFLEQQESYGSGLRAVATPACSKSG
jgi:hypothetical protein